MLRGRGEGGRVAGAARVSGEEQMTERPDRRDDAFWLRLAIVGLIVCVLAYGCWQAVAWFAASLPSDFR